MEWTEIIQLRSSGRSERRRAIQIVKDVMKTNRSKPPKSFKLIKNAKLETDLCVIISWEHLIHNRLESHLGTQLAIAFSQLGLLNHSTWFQDKI